ncbi:hypothetical protein [Pseudoclavibacter sp. Z016]|uniref:hypothetical protein n=1 Tax=Pseudoclavibacter sp. Z016 TaxID=2080581 RepID=UPI000CE83139|nr:hypothetical protein [Pseudoclavibacter sp. Z016]PPF75979.1 hypothetical protein C5B99_08940 [Pseudoclavibacter sp. Z016]
MIALLAAAVVLTGCSSVAPPENQKTDSAPPPPSSLVPPADSAEWASESFGTFDEYTSNGTGELRVELPAEVSKARSGIIDIAYDGSAPLTLWTEDSEGELGMILLDTSIEGYTADPTSFAGQTMWWAANEPPSALLVDADGAWEVTVRPIDSAPQLPESGTGYGAYLYDGPGGAFTGVKPDTGVGMSITEYRSGADGTGGGETPYEAVSEQRRDADFRGELAAGPSLIFVSQRGAWELDLP